MDYYTLPERFSIDIREVCKNFEDYFTDRLQTTYPNAIWCPFYTTAPIINFDKDNYYQVVRRIKVPVEDDGFQRTLSRRNEELRRIFSIDDLDMEGRGPVYTEDHHQCLHPSFFANVKREMLQDRPIRQDWGPKLLVEVLKLMVESSRAYNFDMDGFATGSRKPFLKVLLDNIDNLDKVTRSDLEHLLEIQENEQEVQRLDGDKVIDVVVGWTEDEFEFVESLINFRYEASIYEAFQSFNKMLTDLPWEIIDIKLGFDCVIITRKGDWRIKEWEAKNTKFLQKVAHKIK